MGELVAQCLDGFSVIDGQRFVWESGDVFAIPSWACHEHANTSQTEAAALFCAVDEGEGVVGVGGFLVDLSEMASAGARRWTRSASAR